VKALSLITLMVIVSSSLLAQSAGGEYDGKVLYLWQRMLRLEGAPCGHQPDPSTQFRVRINEDISGPGVADRHRDPCAGDYDKFNPLVSPNEVKAAFGFDIIGVGTDKIGRWKLSESGRAEYDTEAEAFKIEIKLNDAEKAVIERALKAGVAPKVRFTINMVKDGKILWAWLDENDPAIKYAGRGDVIYEFTLPSPAAGAELKASR